MFRRGRNGFAEFDVALRHSFNIARFVKNVKFHLRRTSALPTEPPSPFWPRIDLYWTSAMMDLKQIDD
jgi:hypothetical protein